MLGKSRGSDVERDYSEEEIISWLNEWYGNCVRIEEFCYIVCENGSYYLMKKEIPDIFFTECATKLNKMTQIYEENSHIRFTVVDKEKNNSENLHTYTVFTTKNRVLQQIKRWAI